MKNLFNLSAKTALITGGGGLLGKKHAEAIIEFGGNAIIADYNIERAKSIAQELNKKLRGFENREIHIAWENDLTRFRKLGISDVFEVRTI